MKTSLVVVSFFVFGILIGFQNCAPKSNVSSASLSTTDRNVAYDGSEAGNRESDEEIITSKVQELASQDPGDVRDPARAPQLRIFAAGPSGIPFIDLCGSLQNPVSIDPRNGSPVGIERVDKVRAIYRFSPRRPAVCGYSFANGSPNPDPHRCQTVQEFTEAGSDWINFKVAFYKDMRSAVVPGTTIYLRTLDPMSGVFSRACVFRTE